MEPPLFSYRPGNTIVHRTPAGIKLAAVCVISLQVFSETTVFGEPTAAPWLRAGVYAIIVMILFWCAQIPIRRLLSLRYVFLLGMFVTACRAVHFFPSPMIETSRIPEGTLYMVRFFITAVAALILFETTSRRHIQDVFVTIETLVQTIIPPLKKVPFSAVLGAAIGFIPEIFAVWRTVRFAAAARSYACRKVSARQFVLRTVTELSTLLSCLLARAEATRKAMLNRTP
ncbi:MAG: hypothetical protein IJ191_06860 [Treponema sp.]|nr:hypothetical protein [Treponema sp.]